MELLKFTPRLVCERARSASRTHATRRDNRLFEQSPARVGVVSGLASRGAFEGIWGSWLVTLPSVEEIARSGEM